jgi:hypothetical protein
VDAKPSRLADCVRVCARTDPKPRPQVGGLSDSQLARQLDEEERKREEEDRRLAEELWKREEEEERERKKRKEWEETLTLVRTQAKAESDEELGQCPSLCVLCGVVWCGVVWCGVVWCGVVWCGVSCACACCVSF